MISSKKKLMPQVVLTLLFTIPLALQTGCGLSLEHDPAKSVTVEITGIDNEGDRESVSETLKEFVDGNSHMMSSFYNGQTMTMTITLSPVSDVDAFSKKIEFGEVTSVEGRTVKVTFSDGS